MEYFTYAFQIKNVDIDIESGIIFFINTFFKFSVVRVLGLKKGHNIWPFSYFNLLHIVCIGVPQN